MVRLATNTLAERAIVPAFVYFFRLLYPFAWVNDPAKPTAAAAGGYMLVRRDTLAEIGGLAAIKGALIDDCALAAAIKAKAGAFISTSPSIPSACDPMVGPGCGA